jgi:hypothetical protein
VRPRIANGRSMDRLAQRVTGYTRWYQTPTTVLDGAIDTTAAADLDV